jgi:transposase
MSVPASCADAHRCAQAHAAMAANSGSTRGSLTAVIEPVRAAPCRLHLDADDHLGTQIAELDALVAGAGLAPGDNESAGKRKKAATRKGSKHLRTAMIESAWTAAARSRTLPGARFRRLADRFGGGNEKKAAVAVGHTLICIAWAVMTRGQDYAAAGEDYYEQREHRSREHSSVTTSRPWRGSATTSP